MKLKFYLFICYMSLALNARAITCHSLLDSPSANENVVVRRYQSIFPGLRENWDLIPITNAEYASLPHGDIIEFERFERMFGNTRILKDRNTGIFWDAYSGFTMIATDAKNQAQTKRQFLAGVFDLEFLRYPIRNSPQLRYFLNIGEDGPYDTVATWFKYSGSFLGGDSYTFMPADYKEKGYYFKLYDTAEDYSPDLVSFEDGKEHLYFEHSFNEYLNFIAENYKDRLGVSTDQSAFLQELSRNFRERTILVLQLQEKWHPNLVPRNITGFLSGVFGVQSKDRTQKIPMELLHDIDVRTALKIYGDEKIIEIGRHVSAKGNTDVDTKFLLQFLLTYIAAHPDIKSIVLEADSVRARMWKRLGFVAHELVSERSGEYYQSDTEFILHAGVDTVVSKLIGEN